MTMTNGEMLRKLPDDKLSEWLASGVCCPRLPTKDCSVTGGGCAKCWAHWLRQEATDAD